jgi:pimeloyl-ACP methyl ester carboxylesterase
MCRVARLLVVVLLLAVAGCGADGVPFRRPAPTTPAGEEFAFTATDGTRLGGRWFGSGSTVVVLSNMGDNDPAPWQAFAPALAERGYGVLTFTFRLPLKAVTFKPEWIAATVADLRGAIEYARGRGAQRIVGIGASLGGMATAKVAGSAGIAAVVIIASPPDLPDYGFTVEAHEIAALTMPKLFVSSVDDRVVPLERTRSLFDRAPQPKEWQTYPGAAHGVQILATANGDALRQRLGDFIAANAPG